MMMIHIGWDRGQLSDFTNALSDLNAGAPMLDQLAAADPKNILASYRRVDAYRSIGLVEGYAGHKDRSLDNLKKATAILDDLVKRDPANRNYSLLLAELQGRVANLLVETGRAQEARAFAEPSVAWFRKLGDDPAATPQQLLSARCRREAESLRWAALRFALRADQLASDKDPAALGYLAEAYSLNRDFPKAVDAATRGPPSPRPIPAILPRDCSNKLQQEVASYKAGRPPQ